MNHRRPDVRAAVAHRQRSQDHLRTATATVGLAGVVTAGAVAFILPGSTHAAASARTATAPSPAPSASSGSTTGSAPASAPASPKQHASHSSSSAGSSAGSSAASSPTPAAPPVATVAPPQTVSGGS
ncbi:MAG TPA: hypothetical protein VMV92_13145 [Streptosporangiaceae bacterium]|nr:hypothetical protein [Streptosporangiaceae bacterium]